MTLKQATNQANQAFERYPSLSGLKSTIKKIISYALYPEVSRISEEIHVSKIYRSYPEASRAVKKYMSVSSTLVTLALSENFYTSRKVLK